MNGPVFVAAVIDREGWGADISFVGHANTIQVAVRSSFRVIQSFLTIPGIQPSALLPRGRRPDTSFSVLYARARRGRLQHLNLAKHTS